MVQMLPSEMDRHAKSEINGIHRDSNFLSSDVFYNTFMMQKYLLWE